MPESRLPQRPQAEPTRSKQAQSPQIAAGGAGGAGGAGSPSKRSASEGFMAPRRRSVILGPVAAGMRRGGRDLYDLHSRVNTFCIDLSITAFCVGAAAVLRPVDRMPGAHHLAGQIAPAHLAARYDALVARALLLAVDGLAVDETGKVMAALLGRAPILSAPVAAAVAVKIRRVDPMETNARVFAAQRVAVDGET